MPSPRVDFKFIRTHGGVTFEAVTAHYQMELHNGGSDPAQKKTRCPFHDDHDPSLNINLDKKNFHCFPCGAKGNILDFIMQIEQTKLRPAAIKLAEICGVETAPSDRNGTGARRKTPLERLKTRQNGNSDETASKFVQSEDTEPEAEPEANPEPDAPASEFEPYARELPLDPEHPYLKSRGLEPETIGEFELGFCKAGFQKGRIAIRLRDVDGNPLGYAGRWADDELPEGKPRYLLPKHFPKEAVLFNAHRMEPGGVVMLVESYWSVFRLYELGVPAVSPMGWSISDQHVELLQKLGVQHVFILFDGDKAGREGSASVVEKLVRKFYVQAPDVPDGFKPHKADEALLRELLAG